MLVVDTLANVRFDGPPTGVGAENWYSWFVAGFIKRFEVSVVELIPGEADVLVRQRKLLLPVVVPVIPIEAPVPPLVIPI